MLKITGYNCDVYTKWRIDFKLFTGRTVVVPIVTKGKRLPLKFKIKAIKAVKTKLRNKYHA